MEIRSGKYAIRFENGGIQVLKDGSLLYYNKRPMYAFIKTALSITEFYDKAYDDICEEEGRIVAKGVLKSPAGSELAFTDIYETSGSGFKVSRTVKVLKKVDDFGFASKFALVLAASDNMRDYDYFAPANWYRQNEYAAPHVVGYDLDCEYFWRNEVMYTLPLFAVQNRASGEMVMFSRWAADITMRDLNFVRSEHIVDPKFTIGAIGVSKPENKTLNYLYYGFPLRKEIDTVRDGLTIDYVYPGTDGELPRTKRYNVDYDYDTKTLTRTFHPMEEGFSHSFAIAINFGQYDDYYSMMRDAWRTVYDRLREPYFEVDHELQYRNCMESLTKLTKQYGDSWGLPFSCQLPQLDVSSVSFQFGFVGQQPGIGYQLIRYGDKENRPESYEKGVNIIDFWVRTAMTDIGAPNVCYNPTIEDFEPMPFWTRMIADGLENILDAYVYMKKKGDDRPEWLEFCRKAADWLVRIQNEDGSYYRAYNKDDGSMRMDSKANTISIVRFLIQFYLVTGDEKYKQAALKAGEWAYNNTYKKMEYRGSTCDNADVMDNESGIYAMFGFLALYDLTGEEKWLEALIAAADYTETWTYVWSFPMEVPWPNHPFTKNSFSGQSPVTIGGGGGDMYMAACSYIYYRLYVITGDEHYLDFAKFIHDNTRQANDVDGSFGYALPGLSHEGGRFADQVFSSHYHWLPWVTYIEVDQYSRLY
ncbi:MAG: hypothetical protein GX160_07160, partial [Clostridiales bacterium]|nr:hypothetical protein [Clostridiales bacterium]